MTLSGKTVIFIRTSSVARIPVYQHLRTLGLQLFVVHPFINEAFEGCFDGWLVHETNDVDALQSALGEFVAQRHLSPDAYVSFDEYGVYAAARLSEAKTLRPIPLSPTALQQTSVKSVFRTFCQRHGITSPKSVPVHSPESDMQALLSEAKLEFPVVIKPSPGAGSLLAKLCASMGELTRHAQYMWSVLSGHPDVKHLNALGTNVHLLVEEYIAGQEVDIDCVVENGTTRFVSISDNFETQPPYFTETGGVCPTRLGMVEQQALLELLESFLKAHGTSCHGVLHFEAKYDFTRQKAYVIEVNCRMGSAETNTMVLGTYGVQLGECLVRLALDEPLTNITAASHAVKRHTASVNIYPAAEGALRHVAAPVNDKDLVAYSISAKPGTLVALPPKSFFLLSWMVAQGNTSDEAIENIQRLTAAFEQVVVSAQ